MGMSSKATPEVLSLSDQEHRPVLAHQLIESLQPQLGATVVDGTLGAGGITLRLRERVGDRGLVIAIDRDPEAVDRARGLFGSDPAVVLIHGNFADLHSILDTLNIEAVDAVALDLGISSLQLDSPDRGFS